MKDTVYGNTMENVRKRIDLRRVSNKKGNLKPTSKPSYMSQNKYI